MASGDLAMASEDDITLSSKNNLEIVTRALLYEVGSVCRLSSMVTGTARHWIDLDKENAQQRCFDVRISKLLHIAFSGL